MATGMAGPYPLPCSCPWGASLSPGPGTGQGAPPGGPQAAGKVLLVVPRVSARIGAPCLSWADPQPVLGPPGRHPGHVSPSGACTPAPCWATPETASHQGMGDPTYWHRSCYKAVATRPGWSLAWYLHLRRPKKNAPLVRSRGALAQGIVRPLVHLCRGFIRGPGPPLIRPGDPGSPGGPPGGARPGSPGPISSQSHGWRVVQIGGAGRFDQLSSNQLRPWRPLWKPVSGRISPAGGHRPRGSRRNSAHSTIPTPRRTSIPPTGPAPSPPGGPGAPGRTPGDIRHRRPPGPLGGPRPGPGRSQ